MVFKTFIVSGGGVEFMRVFTEREWAYDRKSHVGRLEKAWNEAVRHDWTVTNMKTEWKKVLRSSREKVLQRGAGLGNEAN